MKINNVALGGVQVSVFANQGAVIDAMFDRLETQGAAVAFSMNAEMIILAQHNPDYLALTRQDCSLCFADGIGVVKAVEIKSKQKLPRLPGCELWEALMKVAGASNIAVFLVGASAKVIQQTQQQLKAQYQVSVVGYADGYFDNEQQLIEQIKSSGARIVSVAMGSPKQEQFIFRCRDAGIQAIFMGVGGTYDVYTNNVKRAPVFWQKAGLEWLYRLLSQPTRWRRQVNLLRFIGLFLQKRL
jgi:UDP-N-acetyl-D-mannosaminouronate:lipid I N-acetyl-D-mannosaminouronosyltransferase